MIKQSDILQKRLDRNYNDYLAQLRGKTADELIALAPEITAAQQLRDELACACSEEDAATLLQFDDPLKEMRDLWAGQQDGCHSEEIGRMIRELHCRGMFPEPKPSVSPAKHIPPRIRRGQER